MDHEDIKVKILQEIDKTERQISQYRKNMKPIAPDNAIGRISRMDAIINKSVIDSGREPGEKTQTGDFKPDVA